MRADFRNGDKIVLIECPPEVFRYDDYLLTYGFFEWWEVTNGSCLLCFRDRRGVLRLVNMNASTVVEVRQPFEKEWDE